MVLETPHIHEEVVRGLHWRCTFDESGYNTVIFDVNHGLASVYHLGP
jgi:hypothetical protein